MNEFLKFFDDKTKDFPMHLEIAYSKICDWNILIYKKGCADDYPKARCNGEDVIIVDESDCDMELCFAKAHVGLKEWLLEFNGGYLGGGRMKHQKDWHTCDRCGAEIKKGILCGNSVTKNGIFNTTYDLCYKCMEDFERFMENE